MSMYECVSGSVRAWVGVWIHVFECYLGVCWCLYVLFMYVC